MQAKTFTRWINSILYTFRGIQINNLFQDIGDGIILNQFLETLCNTEIKYNAKPRLMLQRIENINVALQFIKNSGVQLVGIGAQDITSGHPKLILGLIWTLIIRFNMSDIALDGLSAKESLLLWCRRRTNGYPHVDVSNFTSSFTDGLAFCALIASYRPNLIPFNDLVADNALENLRLAFDVAEQHLGITRLLDPEDIIEYVEEKSIMVYLAQLYHKLSVEETIVNSSVQGQEDFRETFDHFDSDKDGKLKNIDLFGALTFLGEDVTYDSAATIFEGIDTDKDGLIDFDEFKNYVVSLRS